MSSNATKKTGDTFFTLIPDIYHILTKEPDEEWSQIVYRWPLISDIRPTLIICALFVIGTKFIGPHLMSRRPPFKIKPILITYNFTMVAVNAYIFGQYLKWWIGYLPSWRCVPFDRTVNKTSMEVNRIGYYYFITKYIDLLDTVFFVITKKFNHITFLHIIHHTF